MVRLRVSFGEGGVRILESISVHTVLSETTERAFQEPSGNQTGFLEARSGVCVSRVPSIALRELGSGFSFFSGGREGGFRFRVRARFLLPRPVLPGFFSDMLSDHGYMSRSVTAIGHQSRVVTTIPDIHFPRPTIVFFSFGISTIANVVNVVVDIILQSSCLARYDTVLERHLIVSKPFSLSFYILISLVGISAPPQKNISPPPTIPCRHPPGLTRAGMQTPSS